MTFTIKSIGALLLCLVTSTHALSVASLVGKLRLAPTEVDRLQLLSDEDFLFDFLNPPSGPGVTTGAAGHTVAATSANFPAVVGNGVSMTVGFLEPCGMNTPHTHPRATEINFSINTTLRAGLLAENGARFIDIELAAGSATVFPQGAIHFEMNPTCETAMFVAGFNNEDPGVSQVAQRYFGLPPDIVGASLGGLGVVEVAGLEAKIPDNVAFGVDECLKRCNITASNQPSTQRQPRNAGNALPSGSSGSSAAPISSATSSSTGAVSSSIISLSPTASATATTTVGGTASSSPVSSSIIFLSSPPHATATTSVDGTASSPFSSPIIFPSSLPSATATATVGGTASSSPVSSSIIFLSSLPSATATATVGGTTSTGSVSSSITFLSSLPTGSATSTATVRGTASSGPMSSSIIFLSSLPSASATATVGGTASSGPISSSIIFLTPPASASATASVEGTISSSAILASSSGAPTSANPTISVFTASV